MKSPRFASNVSFGSNKMKGVLSMTGFNGGRFRNSSIELLQIISMFMILASHFLVHNVTGMVVSYRLRAVPSLSPVSR